MITNDQYIAFNKLTKWYEKYNHQVIELSGTIDTGINEIIKEFIKYQEFVPQEILYLSKNQRQVLDIASQGNHCYFFDGFVYKYERIVDLDTMPVLSPKFKQVNYVYRKRIKKHSDMQYKIIIVFDSSLLTMNDIECLCTYDIPIILIKDPYLIPIQNSYIKSHIPNIELNESNNELLKNPIIYFTHQILNDKKLIIGNYNQLSITSKKDLNVYNLKASNMIITLSNQLRDLINKVYREKILKVNSTKNIINEKLILTNSLYNYKLSDKNEKHIKFYLHKGLVGNITRCSNHGVNTKYINIDLRPDFYHTSFEDIYIDRFYLNNINSVVSKQEIPDYILNTEYAYALTPILARYLYWDNITLINDDIVDNTFRKILLYTAMTRCKKLLNIII